MDSHFNEADVLKKIISGDRKAFSSLYQQHLSELYNYIYLFTKSRESSEEIVQDIFVKIWEKKENLQYITSFKPYLFKSAKNLLLDEIRRNAVKAKAINALKPDSEDSNERTDEPLIYKQHMKIAEEAIAMLPEKRRAIFLMRTREELSLDEIAAKLNISKSVVKKQLYAGISFVRQYMHRNEILSFFMLLHIFLNYLQRGSF
ncbi:RNA polymerase sigma-70 factor [Pedobacter sp. MC2016-14]|uniref:RNA polymerase sigma factor n=1 Tax=Pedobacter sp. MC2016-14 TaxID=2897327 RepID=UPI001E5F2B64|nr:RNA polymerase sigma-70 factor [Pedobacter sp. MC2016-14]